MPPIMEKVLNGQIQKQVRGSNFQLISGYTSAKILGLPSELEKIQAKEGVLIVDVGPVGEFQSTEGKEVKVAPTTDIYYEYGKFK